MQRTTYTLHFVLSLTHTTVKQNVFMACILKTVTYYDMSSKTDRSKICTNTVAFTDTEVQGRHQQRED